MYALSVVALVGANVLDVVSSRGAYEANPNLRDAAGRFSVGRGVAVKSAASGGLLLMQWLLLKKAPREDLRKPFAVTNIISAGVVGGTAISNFKVPRAPAAPPPP